MEKIFQKSWQRNIMAVLSFSSRLQLFFLSIVITEKGYRATPEEAPVVIAAPHSAFLDSWITFAVACRKMVLYLVFILKYLFIVYAKCLAKLYS